MYARLKSAIAGFDGNFVEAIELDDNRARRVPKKPIGRALDLKEANALIKRLR